MSQVTLPEIVKVFISEPHDEDYVPDPARVDTIVARLEKRIQAPVIREALDWINTNSIKDPSGRSKDEYHWSLYCISGFSMPPHPWVPFELPASVSALLCRAFNWVCFTDLSDTLPRRATYGQIRKVYREAIGRDF